MCAKFHFNCIYLKNSMEGGPFWPPLAMERPKKPSINRIKSCLDFLTERRGLTSFKVRHLQYYIKEVLFLVPFTKNNFPSIFRT